MMLRIYLVGLLLVGSVVAGAWYVVRARPDARLRNEEEALAALRESLPRRWEVPGGTGESDASLMPSPAELEALRTAYIASRTAMRDATSPEEAAAARALRPVDMMRALATRHVVHATESDVEALDRAMRGALVVLNDGSEHFATVLRLGRAFDLAARGSDVVLTDPVDTVTSEAPERPRHRFGGFERWAMRFSHRAISEVHEKNLDPTSLAELLQALATSRQAPRSVVLRFVEDAERRASALRSRFDGRFVVGMTDSFERELSELHAAHERAERWSARHTPFFGNGPEVDELREVDALEFAADELQTRFLLVATRAALLAAEDKDHAAAHITAERDPCVGDPLRLVDGEIAPSPAGQRCLDALRASAGRPAARLRFYQPSRVGAPLIRTHIRACMAPVRACYDTEIGLDRRASGHVRARLGIEGPPPNEVTLDTTGRLSVRFQNCLKAALERCPIQTAITGGRVNVTYPFDFALR